MGFPEDGDVLGFNGLLFLWSLIILPLNQIKQQIIDRQL
jgi:hypothetical protein